MNKKILLSTSMLGVMLAAGTVFAAEKGQLAEYSLPEMNVTALGYEKSNLETPADVTVYSGEELKKTGASDVANALKYKAGVYFTQMGPHGQNWITNSSKATLRGVDNGTLVLINGVPASFNGVSHLDNINLDTVEKIEVVKGGGAVLYGSEAYGGVINVITKKVNNNNFYVAAGNNGQRKCSASVNADKLNIFAGHDELGATENLSVKEGSNSSVWGSNTKYLISFGKSKKDTIGLNYNFNDSVNLSYHYTKKDYSINYNGVKGTLGVLQHFDYDDAEHKAQLNYNNKDFSSVVYYNYRSIDNPDYRFVNGQTGREWEKSQHKMYGFDVKQRFGSESDKFLLGADFKHEIYENNREKFSSRLTTKAASGSWNYNNYSVYGQYDKKLSDVTSVILSAREDIAKYEEKTYHEFLPQAQIITKVDAENAVYASVGKSFRMPNFRNLYYSSGMIIPNPDLSPEKGINYEVGYKFETEGARLNIAAFRTEVKDQIISVNVTGMSNTSTPVNVSEFKNTGVEINYNRDLDKHFSYNLGAIFSNPQRRYAAGQEWSDALGRYQLSGSMNYSNRDLEAALNVSYWGSRVMNGTKTVGGNKQLTVTEINKPLVVSNLHLGYKLQKNVKLTFDVDNLFNRKDIGNVDTSSSQYYTQGRTFLVGMNYSF